MITVRRGARLRATTTLATTALALTATASAAQEGGFIGTFVLGEGKREAQTQSLARRLRKKRAPINVVFLMLVVFMVAGTIAPPPAGAARTFTVEMRGR